VRGFTLASIGKWTKTTLAPQMRVTGEGRFATIADARCVHTPMVVGALKPRDLPTFKWVNTMLGNFKTTLTGAFHSLKYRKCAEHYLAAFAYRFNRRFDLRGPAIRLIVDVVRADDLTGQDKLA